MTHFLYWLDSIRRILLCWNPIIISSIWNHRIVLIFLGWLWESRNWVQTKAIGWKILIIWIINSIYSNWWYFWTELWKFGIGIGNGCIIILIERKMGGLCILILLELWIFVWRCDDGCMGAYCDSGYLSIFFIIIWNLRLFAS